MTLLIVRHLVTPHDEDDLQAFGHQGVHRLLGRDGKAGGDVVLYEVKGLSTADDLLG
jgi:hypothetical protein